MKQISALLLMMLSGGAFAGDVYVQPHTRTDGTYVQGHYRTAPDSTIQNNYSTQGNVNPYTGQAGTVQPDPNLAYQQQQRAQQRQLEQQQRQQEQQQRQQQQRQQQRNSSY